MVIPLKGKASFFDYFCSRNSHISLQTNKNMPSYYNDNTKMSDIICDAPQLLQMMSRFGIPLGVGDRSVQEICATAGVDTPTFLAVANFMRHGSDSVTQHLDQVSVSALMTYLKNAHDYYLSFQLPAIRRKLLEAIDTAQQNSVLCSF